MSNFKNTKPWIYMTGDLGALKVNSHLLVPILIEHGFSVCRYPAYLAKKKEMQAHTIDMSGTMKSGERALQATGEHGA